MEVGTLLKNRREYLGLTLDDVAKALGINKTTIMRWEKGEVKNMKRDKIAKLADTLQISPLLILGQDSELQDSLDELSKKHEKTLKYRSIMNSLSLNPRFEDVVEKIEQLPPEEQERMLNMIESIIENASHIKKE